VALQFTRLVQEMLKIKDVPLEEPDSKGYTPLLNAVLGQNLDMVKSLSSAGANVKAQDLYKGMTPLILACTLGNVEICNHLILDCKAPTNFKDSIVQKTALHYASKVGSLKIVHLLISNGASVEATDCCERTPLFDACEHNKMDICEFLLLNKAKLEHRDKEGFTCVHISCLSGAIECLDILIGRGAVLNAKDNSGRTPLIIASQSGKTECGRLLVKSW